MKGQQAANLGGGVADVGQQRWRDSGATAVHGQLVGSSERLSERATPGVPQQVRDQGLVCPAGGVRFELRYLGRGRQRRRLTVQRRRELGEGLLQAGVRRWPHWRTGEHLRIAAPEFLDDCGLAVGLDGVLPQPVLVEYAGLHWSGRREYRLPQREIRRRAGGDRRNGLG